MRDFVTILLSLSIVILSVVGVYQDQKIRNLELKYCKLEEAYGIIIEENRSLLRQIDTDLRLLSEGGWE